MIISCRLLFSYLVRIFYRIFEASSLEDIVFRLLALFIVPSMVDYFFRDLVPSRVRVFFRENLRMLLWSTNWFPRALPLLIMS